MISSVNSFGFCWVKLARQSVLYFLSQALPGTEILVFASLYTIVEVGEVYLYMFPFKESSLASGSCTLHHVNAVCFADNIIHLSRNVGSTQTVP